MRPPPPRVAVHRGRQRTIGRSAEPQRRRPAARGPGSLVAVACALLLAPGAVPAQSPASPSPALAPEGSRILGEIRSRPEDGGESLPHAMVEVVGGRRVVFADREGRYELDGLRGGVVRIRAVHLGFADAEVEIVLPDSGTVSVDLELRRRFVELPGLLVEARPPTLRDPDRPESPEETMHRPLVQLGALGTSPGISESGVLHALADGDGSGRRSRGGALLLQGSAADLETVLLDGVPIRAPFHLGGVLEGFDSGTLAEARRWIGGAPARYGAGLSGILDLRTRAPRRDRVHASTTLDLMSAGGSLELPVGDRVALLFSGRLLHDLAGPSFGAGGSSSGYGEGLLRLQAEVAGDLAVTAFENGESVRLDLPAEAGGGVREASWGNRLLAAAWRSRFGNTDLRVGASGSGYGARLPLLAPDSSGGPSRPVLVDGRTDRWRLTVDASRAGEAGPLRAGISVDLLDAHYDRPVASPDGEVEISESGAVLGGYVEGSRAVAEELILQAGARMDRFATRGPDLSKVSYRGALRLALLWTLTPEAILTLSGGRYHQLAQQGDTEVDLQPDPEAVGEDPGGGTATVPASPLLSVARSDHLVVSLRQRLGESVSASTGLFVKSFENVPGVESGGLRSSGVDLRIAHASEGSSAWLGYQLSWFWHPTGLEGAAGSAFTGRHLLTAGMERRLGGPLGFDLRVRFSDGLPLTQVPFVVVDAAEADEPDGGESGGETPTGIVDPGLADGFFRVDAEIFGEWVTKIGNRESRIRPYLRVLNALDRRDALFYYVDALNDDGPRPLGALPFLPVVGLEWRF